MDYLSIERMLSSATVSDRGDCVCVCLRYTCFLEAMFKRTDEISFVFS